MRSKTGKFVAVAATQGIIGWVATQTILAVSQPGNLRTVVVGVIWLAVMAAGAYILVNWKPEPVELTHYNETTQDSETTKAMPADPVAVAPLTSPVKKSYSDRISLPDTWFSWDFVLELDRLLDDAGMQGRSVSFGTKEFNATAANLADLASDIRKRPFDEGAFEMTAKYGSDSSFAATVQYWVYDGWGNSVISIGGSDESRVRGTKLLLQQLVDSWDAKQS